VPESDHAGVRPDWNVWNVEGGCGVSSDWNVEGGCGVRSESDQMGSQDKGVLNFCRLSIMSL
jgi:hypothetical protein